MYAQRIICLGPERVEIYLKLSGNVAVFFHKSLRKISANVVCIEG